MTSSPLNESNASWSPEGSEGQQTSEKSGAVIDELAIRDMDIREVIEMIARKGGLNIVTSSAVSGKVTIFLSRIDAKDALRTVLAANGAAFFEEGGIIHVMTNEEHQQNYGFEFGKKKVTRLIKVNFISIKDLSVLLNEMKSADGKIVVNEATKNIIMTDLAEKVDAMEALIQDMDVQTLTVSISLKHIDVQDVLEEAQALLTESVGVVECDIDRNRLIVTDEPSNVARIKGLVEELDAQGRKVIVQAKLVHVALNSENLQGVDWSGIVNDYQKITLQGQYDFLERTAGESVLSMGMIEEYEMPILLDALDTVGFIKEYPLSDILVSQDHVVEVFVRLDQPSLDLYRVRADMVDENKGLLIDKVALEFIMRIAVTPDEQIKVELFPHEPKVKQDRGAENIGTFFVGPEDTVVLGGMVVTEKVAKTHKIPLMGDLPLLGFAFRFRDSSINREEYIVFLTPRIVNGAGLSVSGNGREALQRISTNDKEEGQ